MNEETLIQALRDGDHAAFDVFFRMHRNLVYSIAFRKVRDAEVAKDITQDIFGWLWGHRQSLVEIRNVKGYLITATLHAASRFLSTQQRHRKALLGFSTTFQDHQSVDQRDRELPVGVMIEAIKALSPGKRRIFQLFYLQGKSAINISEDLGISYQHVRNSLYQARAEIKKSVDRNRKGFRIGR